MKHIFIKSFCVLSLVFNQSYALQIYDVDALERTLITAWNQVITQLVPHVQHINYYMYDTKTKRPVKRVTEDDWSKEYVRIADTDTHRTLITRAVQKAVTETQIPLDIFTSPQVRQATGWLPMAKRLWAYYVGMRGQAEQIAELRTMMTRIMTNYFVEFLLQTSEKELYWCPCVPEARRIALVVCMATDTRNAFANHTFTKDAPLIYTSFASGTLMQDYLMVSELLESFPYLQVNIIDLFYPDVLLLKEIQKKEDEQKNMPHSARSQHLETLAEFADHAKTIDTFKLRIAQLVSLKGATNYFVEVTPYDDSYQYIEYVKRNPAEKSHILYLTDPSAGHGAETPFPSLANAVDIWIDDIPENSALTLYVPRHQPIQLYELVGTPLKGNEGILSKAQKDAKYKVTKELMHVIRTIGANKGYTSKLMPKLLLDQIAVDRPLTPEGLRKIGFERIAAQWERQMNPTKTDIFFGEPISEDLFPVTFEGIQVLMSFGSDPHISFQDLVWDALQPKAIVYKLYDLDPSTDEDSSQIIRIDPNTYKKADAIGKLGGGGEYFAANDFYPKRRVM